MSVDNTNPKFIGITNDDGSITEYEFDDESNIVGLCVYRLVNGEYVKIQLPVPVLFEDDEYG